jgi:hypothetical protein
LDHPSVVASPEHLYVGAASQSRPDPNQHVAGAKLRHINGFDPQVLFAVKDRSGHFCGAQRTLACGLWLGHQAQMLYLWG